MNRKITYLAIPLMVFTLLQCKNGVTNSSGMNTDSTGVHQPGGSNAANKFSGVMMEGFYWNVPKGGNWWNTIKNKIAVLANISHGYGIDRIWLPPAYKAQSGPQSMGYDPYDYYDLGNFHQKGTTETRFGSRKELESLIAALKKNHIKVMEDIVLNHRSGGAKEWNPYTKDSTYTDFSGVKSGKAKWHWQQFHPNSVSQSDPGKFGNMPDVCYKCKPVSADIKTWMNWLQDSVGFNGGWRFDYVKGIYPWVVTEMKKATGNAFSIGEYYDGNVDKVNTWINQTRTNDTPSAHAFDFPLYYTMVNVFEKTDGSGNISDLVNPNKSLAAKRPGRAVTFAGNHDTDKIVKDKMLAYAFILTYKGYPCIWWKDYFNYGLDTSAGKSGNGINPLVWVRGKLAKGNPSIRLIKADDSDILVYAAKGTSSSHPGYIVVMDDNPSGWRNVAIQTKNSYLQGKTLKAYAWYSTVKGKNSDPNDASCDQSGNVKLSVPPRGYAVYSVKGF
ncbi:MAG TPA: alpha-amylase family glycosyl hydrolase [Balneolaceae bacterium]|nr:alpha-amylase family glycosyl hydrolase [Balneolaceae bacterium]